MFPEICLQDDSSFQTGDERIMEQWANEAGCSEAVTVALEMTAI